MSRLLPHFERGSRSGGAVRESGMFEREERHVKRLRVPILLVGCLALVGAGAVLASLASASPTKKTSMTGTISVVYSESYEFDAKNLTDTWWARVKKQFEAKYPGAHLKTIPVGGTDFDEQKKAALLPPPPRVCCSVFRVEFVGFGIE